MAFENGFLDANLAASVGDDVALIAELRAAFIDSVARQVDLLQRSRCDANWHMAAMRLKGVAASFGVSQIIALADEALESAPGDPVILRKLQRIISGFAD